MAQLTNEQLRLAVSAFSEEVGAFCGREEEGLRAAAQYLQLPWDDPTEMEVRDVMNTVASADLRGRERDWKVREVVSEFVRRRNAALLPKPVDPRRKVIKSVLMDHAPKRSDADSVVDDILAALDAQKGGS